jgi:hypothetical protein
MNRDEPHVITSPGHPGTPNQGIPGGVAMGIHGEHGMEEYGGSDAPVRLSLNWKKVFE